METSPVSDGIPVKKPSDPDLVWGGLNARGHCSKGKVKAGAREALVSLV